MSDEREGPIRFVRAKEAERDMSVSAVNARLLKFAKSPHCDVETHDDILAILAILARAQGPGPGEAVDRKAAFVEGYKAAWSGRGDHTEPRREYIAKLAADAWDDLAATPTREV